MFSIFKDEQAVINELQRLIEKIANESITARDKFFIGFSGKIANFKAKHVIYIYFVLGGSLGKYLTQTLPDIKTDWSKWTVFFCDERYVPENDSESTFG